MHKYIDVARIVSPKGLDGRVTLYCAPNVAANLSSQITFYFVPPVLDFPRSGKIASIDIVDGRNAIVSFDSVSDIDTAEALVGCHCLMSEIVADEQGISKSDNVSNCIGVLDNLDIVINDTSFPLGWKLIDVVSGYSSHVFEALNPAGQILLNVNADSPVLIPFVDDLIENIDVRNKIIYMRLPKGLVDL